MGTNSQRGYQMGITRHDKAESFTPSALSTSPTKPRAASGQIHHAMAAEYGRKLASYKESQRFCTVRLAGLNPKHMRRGASREHRMHP